MIGGSVAVRVQSEVLHHVFVIRSFGQEHQKNLMDDVDQFACSVVEILVQNRDSDRDGAALISAS